MDRVVQMSDAGAGMGSGESVSVEIGCGGSRLSGSGGSRWLSRGGRRFTVDVASDGEGLVLHAGAGLLAERPTGWGSPSNCGAGWRDASAARRVRFRPRCQRSGGHAWRRRGLFDRSARRAQPTAASTAARTPPPTSFGFSCQDTEQPHHPTRPPTASSPRIDHRRKHSPQTATERSVPERGLSASLGRGRLCREALALRA